VDQVRVASPCGQVIPRGTTASGAVSLAAVNWILTVDQVRAEVATGLWWPHFGRTRALNIAADCASVSSVSTRQRSHGQVADAAVTLYGSEGHDHGAHYSQSSAARSSSSLPIRAT